MAISYGIAVGQNLQQVTVGANIPAATFSIELRMDTGAVSVAPVNDASYPGGTRVVKKGEIQQMIRILEEYLIGDPNIPQ